MNNTKFEEKIAEAAWYSGKALIHYITIYNDEEPLHHYIVGDIHVVHANKREAMNLLVNELKKIGVEV